MNYIKQLEQDKMTLAVKLSKVLLSLEALHVHLHSPKFINEGGERKDWIATSDVINWIMEVKGGI